MTRPSDRHFDELRKIRITRDVMTNKGATPPCKSPKLGSFLQGVPA
jgi:hypothetical protein